MLIAPTVGRVVWFHPGGYRDATLAAIVCFVHHDRLVNLAYFTAEGACMSATSVELWHGEGPRPLQPTAYCEWMPYQKGQAAKTEAAEAMVKSGFIPLGSAKES